MSNNTLVAAARGEGQLTLAITDSQLVNVFTGEIYPVDVGIWHDRIAYIGPVGSCASRANQVIDAKGRYLSYGLIDTHIHIESTMLTPVGFAEAVLPLGTTTVIADPHEIANVFGLDGVRYMLDVSSNLPLKIYILAPSCVPSVPGLETAGAEFGAKEIEEMLSWPRVIGLGEVMDYKGVITNDNRMTEIVKVAQKKGVVIGGHCPKTQGSDLQAYIAAGPDSDHEVKDKAELLEKLRSGMTIEAHEAFHSQNISVLAECLQDLPLLPPNISLCIDDILVDTLLHQGHINRVLRRAVGSGLSPAEALRIATYQAAQRWRLHSMGAIVPGNIADLILIDDLSSFKVSLVIANGQIVAENGTLVRPFTVKDTPLESQRAVVLENPPTLETFRIACNGMKRLVRVIECERGTSFTRFVQVELPVKEGLLDWTGDPSLCLIAVFERHGREGHFSLGLVKGFGLQHGALASTVAHDSHNLVVIGRDTSDMVSAVQVLCDSNGGMVFVKGGDVEGIVELPIAGLMSKLTPADLANKVEQLTSIMKLQGVVGPHPLMSITSLALIVLPEARISDLGLVDVRKKMLLPLLCD